MSDTYKKTKQNLSEMFQTCLEHLKAIKDSFSEETKVFIDEARKEFQKEKNRKRN